MLLLLLLRVGVLASWSLRRAARWSGVLRVARFRRDDLREHRESPSEAVHVQPVQREQHRRRNTDDGCDAGRVECDEALLAEPSSGGDSHDGLHVLVHCLEDPRDEPVHGRGRGVLLHDYVVGAEDVHLDDRCECLHARGTSNSQCLWLRQQVELDLEHHRTVQRGGNDVQVLQNGRAGAVRGQLLALHEGPLDNERYIVGRHRLLHRRQPPSYGIVWLCVVELSEPQQHADNDTAVEERDGEGVHRHDDFCERRVGARRAAQHGQDGDGLAQPVLVAVPILCQDACDEVRAETHERRGIRQDAFPCVEGVVRHHIKEAGDGKEA
eukprot:PhM_4_TR5772/c0_g1_i1/m.30695